MEMTPRVGETSQTQPASSSAAVFRAGKRPTTKRVKKEIDVQKLDRIFKLTMCVFVLRILVFDNLTS